MLGLEVRVAVNAVTAVLVFCECSSSVHLFQIYTEMPSSRFKHLNILEKLKIFKPDDVSCTQCRIEANEMEMEDFCCKYIQTCA